MDEKKGKASKIDSLEEGPAFLRSQESASEKQDSSADPKVFNGRSSQDYVAVRQEMQTLARNRAADASRRGVVRTGPFKNSRFRNKLNASNFVERLLWRRFLDARQDLMKSYIRIQATASSGGSMNWGAIDAETARHSQAIEAFQQAKNFTKGAGKLEDRDERMLLVQATLALVVDEYEGRARENGDEDRAKLIQSIRAEFEQSRSDLLSRTEVLGNWEENGQLSQARNLTHFFAVGMFGGFMLLVPMTIMVLSPGILTSLLTTTLFVYLITCILALVFSSPRNNNQAQLKDMFAAVAAYTAVLVVFVGASAQTSEKIDKSSKIIPGLVLGIPGLLVIFGLGLLYCLYLILFLKEYGRAAEDIETMENTNEQGGIISESSRA